MDRTLSSFHSVGAKKALYITLLEWRKSFTTTRSYFCKALWATTPVPAKISNLLCEHDNDDKIVNISKLDEVLYSDERKPKNNELFQKHMEGDSKFDLIIGDQNESDNTNPIINISNLEISIFKSEQNEQKINKSIEDNNQSNDNMNKKENNNNKITIIKGKDEVLKIKKNKKCFLKLPFYCKIILIVNIFIILTFLLFFLFKIIINKFYY